MDLPSLPASFLAFEFVGAESADPLARRLATHLESASFGAALEAFRRRHEEVFATAGSTRCEEVEHPPGFMVAYNEFTDLVETQVRRAPPFARAPLLLTNARSARLQLGSFLTTEGYESLHDFVAYLARLDDCSALLVDILVASTDYDSFFRFMTDV